MPETPEHILTAAEDLCEYIRPTILAELVDDWSLAGYLELAQIAFDAGDRNCGADQLAQYIVDTTSTSIPHPKPAHYFLQKWSERGVRVFLKKEQR